MTIGGAAAAANRLTLCAYCASTALLYANYRRNEFSVKTEHSTGRERSRERQRVTERNREEEGKKRQNEKTFRVTTFQFDTRHC